MNIWSTLLMLFNVILYYLYKSYQCHYNKGTRKAFVLRLHYKHRKGEHSKQYVYLETAHVWT